MSAMIVFKTNGHDYSRYVEVGGYSWTRNDLDSENTGRTTWDGLMHRSKITEKRTCAFTVLSGTPRAVLAQLDDDLRRNTFEAEYMDLHGQQTRNFYCSSFKVTMESAYDEDGQWGGGSFNVIEV